MIFIHLHMTAKVKKKDMGYASCLFQLTKQYQAVVNKKIKYIYFMYLVIGSVGVCVYVYETYIDALKGV